MAENKFETWGILELFGHKRLAGQIREQTIGSATMIRIDVPAVGDQKEFTKLYGPSAIYGITPTDEITARAAAEAWRERPLDYYTIQPLIDEAVNNRSRLLQAAADAEIESLDPEEEDGF
jgi:hypothetical protein